MRKYHIHCALFIVITSIIAAALPLAWRPAGSRAAAIVGKSEVGRRTTETATSIDLPIVAPVQYLPVSAGEAIALNAKQPNNGKVGPAAMPFAGAGSSLDLARATKCLTEAVYYEAGSQEIAGQRAVAQVVLNRVRSPAFPSTVCGVVYQGAERVTGCQFTFACDGSLSRAVSKRAWARAHQVAKGALGGFVFQPVGYSTHYHADWVVPYWASSLVRETSIGAHIFYRWKGLWGEPKAFRQRYTGIEPGPSKSQLLDQVATAWQNEPDLAVDAPLVTLPLDADPSNKLKVESHLAESVMHRSILQADEKPARLVASAETQPQMIRDRRPAALVTPGGEQR
jgi:hypothetical protein